MLTFTCPNCKVTSEFTGIKVDEEKRSRANEMQKKIEEMEINLEKQREKKMDSNPISFVNLEAAVMGYKVLVGEHGTKYKYVECSVCGYRHYIEGD